MYVPSCTTCTFTFQLVAKFWHKSHTFSEWSKKAEDYPSTSELNGRKKCSFLSLSYTPSNIDANFAVWYKTLYIIIVKFCYLSFCKFLKFFIIEIFHAWEIMITSCREQNTLTNHDFKMMYFLNYSNLIFFCSPCTLHKITSWIHMYFELSVIFNFFNCTMYLFWNKVN